MSDFEALKSGKHLSHQQPDEFDDLFWEANGGKHNPKRDHEFSAKTFEALMGGESVPTNPHEIYNNTLYKRKLHGLYKKHNIQGELRIQKRNALIQKVLGNFDSICRDMRHTFAYQKYSAQTKKPFGKIKIARKASYTWKKLGSEQTYQYFKKLYEENATFFVPEQSEKLNTSYSDMQEVLDFLRRSNESCFS